MNGVDRLPVGVVLRVLAVVGLISLPHVLHLPIWISALATGVILWRAVAAWQGRAMPPSWLRLGLAGGAFVGVYLQFGTLNGHYSGVALLVAMLAMKLTEMTTRRDYLVVIYLCYFLLVTHFLFSQEMLMILVLLAGAWAITMVLIDVNHPQAELPLRRSAGLAGRLILPAIPLMLLFFVLFPRIPGPLWGLPSDAGAGLSGLSDKMEPGSISSLSLSDEVAFRVQFAGDTPARKDLYWRGPVFQFFNGRGWLPGAIEDFPREIQVSWEPPFYDYELQLEAHGQRYLLALDLPMPEFPRLTQLNQALTLSHRDKITDKRLYRLRSAPQFSADTALPTFARRFNLSLPEGNNPQTRALAERWRRNAGADDRAVVNQALRHFRQTAFTYTLQPPLMPGTNSIDQFVFEYQRGFCELFAGAFTFMMRAAGIPARVVTGYQGGEPNGDYLIVRQSDAHAWSEVWLDGRGWTRVDPTGAVAPNRIELGLASAVAEGEPVPALARARIDPNLLVALQLRWDQVNALWNRVILAYGPDLQEKFLSRLGLPGLRETLIALTVASVGVLALLWLWLSRQTRDSALRDPLVRQWLRFRRKLARRGVISPPSEGPQDLLARVERERADLLPAARQISRLYQQLRYANRTDPVMQRALQRRVRRFPKS